MPSSHNNVADRGGVSLMKEALEPRRDGGKLRKWMEMEKSDDPARVKTVTEVQCTSPECGRITPPLWPPAEYGLVLWAALLCITM